MCFFDRVLGLCKERGTSPSAVAREIGLNNSSATYWKRGSIPKGDTLQKLADYFGVSIDYLLGKETDEGKRPRRPIKDRIKDWKSNKLARLYMCIDSDLLSLIEIFAEEDGISLEDEVEKILHEESENRVEQFMSDAADREFAQLPPEKVYPYPHTDVSSQLRKDTSPPPSAPETPPEGK